MRFHYFGSQFKKFHDDEFLFFILRHSTHKRSYSEKDDVLALRLNFSSSASKERQVRLSRVFYEWTFHSQIFFSSSFLLLVLFIQSPAITINLYNSVLSLFHSSPLIYFFFFLFFYLCELVCEKEESSMKI